MSELRLFLGELTFEQSCKIVGQNRNVDVAIIPSPISQLQSFVIGVAIFSDAFRNDLLPRQKERRSAYR